MRKLLVMALPVLMACSLFGQKVHHFTEGMMVSSNNRYGREALYADQLLYQLYTNSLKKPANGDSFDVNTRGQAIKWQVVKADSLNRMGGRGGFGGGGYIYFTYKSDKEQPALLNIKGNSAVIVNQVLHTGDAYSSGWL